ncbi:hypothetical protein GYMLUDRAFT_865295 [Collybiopsis luxurians FD-317 M1]|nr:hypothetical protein GYMLUDRAFT_865295 [Collybiopsis luxurians FD-317 M1]
MKSSEMPLKIPSMLPTLLAIAQTLTLLHLPTKTLQRSPSKATFLVLFQNLATYASLFTTSETRLLPNNILIPTIVMILIAASVIPRRR